MKTFKQYMEDSWGHDQETQELIARIESEAASLGKDISDLSERLSHGDDPMNHAMRHLQRSLHTLVATFRTSVTKNTNSPEMCDHPPVTISSS